MAAALPASAYLGEEGKIRPDMKDRPPVARRASPWVDTLFSALAHGAAWLTLALLAGILVSLVIGAAPAIRAYGLSFLWTSDQTSLDFKMIEDQTHQYPNGTNHPIVIVDMVWDFFVGN